MSTQPASHRSTDGQVIEGWHSAHGHPAYKRGVTGSNPVAPTRSEGMLGGPVGSRRAKRRVVPLPGQSRWLPLRRHQDAPATAGTEASRHRSGRAARAGGCRRPTISRWGVVARQLPGVRHDDRHHARTAQRQVRLPADHPERSACATSEFPGAAAHVREHYVRGRRPSRGGRSAADHQQTRTTESVYCRELRPVITIGAEIRDQIFPS